MIVDWPLVVKNDGTKALRSSAVRSTPGASAKSSARARGDAVAGLDMGLGLRADVGDDGVAGAPAQPFEAAEPERRQQQQR